MMSWCWRRDRVLKLFAITLLAALVALPIAVRAAVSQRPAHAEIAVKTATLIIITPHGESTRSEFERAFAAWELRTHGVTVSIDWRTPGGTADITRYLDSRFAGEVRARFPELKNPKQFNDAKLPATTPERAAFLSSDVGIGLDLLWGGGEFPHRQLADKGYLVDAGLQALEPTWFRDDVIPQTLSGETVYDAKGRYYGVCFSTFGICWNPDALALLPDATPPAQWDDLGAARFAKQLTIADPTRSAAVVTTFERIIQEQMAKRSEADKAAGWSDGLVLLKRMVGNARAITDGASRATRDVVRGDATAGTAIDFHARAEAEWSALESGGSPRLRFVAPVGGTSVSADPIALLRGAPHRDLAVDFMRFVLSPAGQRLWTYRVGAPGGPTRWTLHRLAVRRDVYTADDRACMSDAAADPFALAAQFTYRPQWSAKLYPLIGPLCKAVMLDPRDELQRAWLAIIAAGGPDRVPEAWRAFCWLPCAYADAPAARDALAAGPPASLRLLRAWTTTAQTQYRDAETLAKAGR